MARGPRIAASDVRGGPPRHPQVTADLRVESEHCIASDTFTLRETLSIERLPAWTRDVMFDYTWQIILSESRKRKNMTFRRYGTVPQIMQKRNRPHQDRILFSARSMSLVRSASASGPHASATLRGLLREDGILICIRRPRDPQHKTIGITCASRALCHLRTLKCRMRSLLVRRPIRHFLVGRASPHHLGCCRVRYCPSRGPFSPWRVQFSFSSIG